MKSWALKCCGCDRLIGVDGRPMPPLPPSSVAAFDFSHIATSEFSVRAATFDTKEEADTFAEKHGWSARSAAGADHRCPDCQRIEADDSKPALRKVGAYVSTAASSGYPMPPSNVTPQTKHDILKVGDQVRMIEGRPAYLEMAGIGTIVNITATRVVVKWQVGRRPRNHLRKSLMIVSDQEEKSVQ